MLERGVYELAHSFFHYQLSSIQHAENKIQKNMPKMLTKSFDCYFKKAVFKTYSIIIKRNKSVLLII